MEAVTDTGDGYWRGKAYRQKLLAVLCGVAAYSGYSEAELQVTEIFPEPSFPDCLRSQAEEMGLERSPGLHLTPIIYDIEHTIKSQDEWCTEDELSAFGSVGFLWERIFEMAHREAFIRGDMVRPGEFTLDGITGSPDLVKFSPGYRLIETKATWKSAKKFDDLTKNFWKWLAQTKAYCHMIGATECEIHCLFICGDWYPPIPKYRSVLIRYGQDELRSNWRMITGHAKEKGWL